MTTTFDEAAALGEVIALADSQMLRSIRDIRHRTVDKIKLERLYAEKELLKKKCEKNRHRPWYAERLKWVKDKINRTMFVPDYVTVVMEHPKHYEYIFNNGIWINRLKYERVSCSAGQARISTVVLCSSEVTPELERRLNNGRDMTKKLAPSKFNAYFGLAGSATKVVSEPRFIVVKDYENTVKFMANFVTETDWAIDDEIDQREVELKMNRTDGMGLISPELSQRWADELGLSWTPSQWIIRQSFLKGMVCTFDFRAFCDEINDGSYIVNTIYQDDNGEYIKADLREVDLIVSESQFKLWDSWRNSDEYIECCHKNKLQWGVAQYSPQELKNVLAMNYQFLQTLNLGQHEVEEVCEQFVDWITGVSFENRAYMLLFLLGENITEETVRRFITSGDKWWIKALAVNSMAQNDPFIRRKIRELVIRRIQNAAMGEIFVNGCFMTMVSDPFAYMQHVCGQEPVGLLGSGEYYCKYWNDRGIKQVDSMRSPLVARCEHVVADLINTEKTRRWYQYCNSGFIVNWHDHSVVNWGGADFDGDLVASTSNETIISSTYRDELTVTYDAPKPSKILFSKADLYRADLFSFGSAIGSITNKATANYAMLPLIERQYGKRSGEYLIAESRLKQSCVAQGKSIDKAKIGQKVKSIPDVWINRQRIEPDDSPECIAYKETMNHILLNRKPYFFKYRYPKVKRDFSTYEAQKQFSCKATFGLTIKQLESRPRKTPEQRKWLEDYYAYAPLIISDSPMNLLCRYIERVDFEIAKAKSSGRFDWSIYIDPYTDYEDEYEDVVKCYKRHLKDVAHMKAKTIKDDGSLSESDAHKFNIEMLRDKMRYVCTNPKVITNALVWYLFEESPNSKKDLLWDAYGEYMFKAARGRNRDKGTIAFPMPSETGSIEYLGKRYEWMEVGI